MRSSSVCIPSAYVPDMCTFVMPIVSEKQIPVLLKKFNKKLKEYVSCEFNRSADRSILNFAILCWPKRFFKLPDTQACLVLRPRPITFPVFYTWYIHIHGGFIIEYIYSSSAGPSLYCRCHMRQPTTPALYSAPTGTIYSAHYYGGP